jgi:crossover junction endodeoxyribonuclease RuvC
MLFLGVDPGLRLTGYGCVRALPSGRHALVEAGVIRLSRASRASSASADAAGAGPSVSQRLVELDAEFRELLDRLRPSVVAVEGLFSHAAYPDTAAIMGHARGVLLLAIAQRGVALVEVKPTMVKKSMTGSGRADKAQVQRAVQQYFALDKAPSPPDVADALAIALCAAQRGGIEAGHDAGRSAVADALLRATRRTRARRLPGL